ncbi:hypothetical protein XANCAGTX0491_000821 [Xanthoria calcicola]
MASSTPKPNPRPQLNVSHLGQTLHDWETANSSFISLYRLLHHQADKAQEFASGLRAYEQATGTQVRERASSSQISPIDSFKHFSTENRQLADLWEACWEEEMHKRRMVLLDKEQEMLEREAVHNAFVARFGAGGGGGGQPARYR